MKIFRAILLLILSVPVIANADTFWRQYGFNPSHTSYNKSETTLNKFNVDRLALFWTSETFRAPGSGPTLGFRSIFIATGGRVRALRAETGALQWARLSCSGEGAQQPAIVNGLLLVGDNGGDLAAYDPTTGDQVWCDDESGSITSAPAVAEHIVFITNGVDAVAIDSAGRAVQLAQMSRHQPSQKAEFLLTRRTPSLDYSLSARVTARSCGIAKCRMNRRRP